MLGGCAGLQDLAQGSLDQAATAKSEPRVAVSFQVTEDALAYRDHLLSKTLQLQGRTIARSYSPKTRVQLVAASRDDANWLIAGIQDGIRPTGRPPEAVMWPVALQLSNAYPRITVIESAAPANTPPTRVAALPSQPWPLTEPMRGVRYIPPPADFRVTMIDPVSPESRDHLATIQDLLEQRRR